MPPYRSNGGPPRHPRLRATVNRQVASLSEGAFESVLERAGIDANAAEDWLSSLAKIGSQVLPIAGRVIGTAYGGPVGGAIGGTVGGLAGNALGQYAGGGGGGGQPGRAAPVPVPGAPPSPGAPAPAVAGSPAAAQLMQLLSRPEVPRTLLAMAMGGQVGAPSMPVGNADLPVSAIANAIGQLAQQASAEYETSYGDGTSAAYLDAIPGRYDATDPVSRAEAVQTAFATQDAIRRQVSRARRAARAEAYDGDHAQDGADAYDAYDAADAYLRQAPASDDGWTERDYQEAALLVDALADLES